MAHTSLGASAAPASLVAVVGPVEAELARVLDDAVGRWAGFDPKLDEPLDALRTLVLSGGKRLRPSFCHWGAVAAGGAPGDPAVVRAGAALELLHAFALVHDDVMDGSATRRGRPTTHLRYAEHHRSAGLRGEGRRFGEGMAILLGDLSHALADVALGEVPAPARIVWNELRVEVDIGQVLDLVATADGSVDGPTARRIARCKSGGYTVERPLHLGAALAGRLDATAAALSAYGGPLGEAFQMRDDVLGVFGSPERTGKPVGDDLREGKPTALLARATELAEGPARAVLASVGDPGLSAADIARLQDVLVETGALAAVEAEIVERREEALDALTSPDLAPPARPALGELAWFVTERDG